MSPKSTQLKKGVGNIRQNVAFLMQPARSPARKKAIITISKKHNIPRNQAQFRQAIKIAQTQGRK